MLSAPVSESDVEIVGSAKVSELLSVVATISVSSSLSLSGAMQSEVLCGCTCTSIINLSSPAESDLPSCEFAFVLGAVSGIV